MRILAENADFTLAHDETNRWLYLRWRGRQSHRTILVGSALILDYVRQTGCPKILSDSTQDEDGWGQLVQWLAQNFFQQLATNGVEAVAWVLPTNLRARIDVQQVVAEITYPVTDVFMDVEEAYQWLHGLPSLPLL